MSGSEAGRSFESGAPFARRADSRFGSGERLAKRRPEKQRGHDPHRDAERLAHAKPMRKYGIRIAEDFGDVAEDSVEGEKQRREQAGPVVQAKHAQSDLHDRKQQQALHCRFVKLARMARQLIGSAGEHHRPGYVGYFSPQFAIDEISDPAEKQSDWRNARDEITDFQ